MTHHDRPRCPDRPPGSSFNVDIDIDISAKLGADAYWPGNGHCRPRPHCPPPDRPPIVCSPPVLPPSYERPQPMPRPCPPPNWGYDRPYIPAQPVVCPPERPPYIPAHPRPQMPGCHDFTFGGSLGFGDSFTSWNGSLDPNGWSVSGRGVGFGQASRGAVSFGRPDTGCFGVPRQPSLSVTFDSSPVVPYATYRNTYRPHC